MCRVLSHEFGVVRPYRTGLSGVQGAYALVRGGSSTSNLVEPSRTNITEIAKCVEFCHMSSGWFDQPNLLCLYIITGETRSAGFLCTSSGWFKHIEPHHYRDSKVCRVLSHEFGVVRLYRTFSVYIVTGETRSAGCLCTSSGWFKHIEPRRTFSNHIITEIDRVLSRC